MFIKFLLACMAMRALWIHDTDFPQNCADLKVCNLSFDTRIFFTELEILLNNDFKLAYILYSVYEKMQISIEEINNLQELFPIPDTHLVFDLYPYLIILYWHSGHIMFWYPGDDSSVYYSLSILHFLNSL